jgi:hypothetical protein
MQLCVNTASLSEYMRSRDIRIPKMKSPGDALYSKAENVSKMSSGRLDEAPGCDMVRVAIWGFRERCCSFGKRKSREIFTSLCLSAKDKFGRVTQLKVFKGSVTIGADAEVVEEPLPACTEWSPFPVLSNHVRNRAAALCWGVFDGRSAACPREASSSSCRCVRARCLSSIAK